MDIFGDIDTEKENYRETIFSEFKNIICNAMVSKKNVTDMKIKSIMFGIKNNDKNLDEHWVPLDSDENEIYNNFISFLQSLEKNNFIIDKNLQKKLKELHVITMTQGKMGEAFTDKSFDFNCLAGGSFMASDGRKKIRSRKKSKIKSKKSKIKSKKSSGNYTITNYTKNKAKKLGVEVKRSANKNKKLDVFKNGKKIASVGAIGYKDYPTYMLENGKEFANKRRSLYQQRHKGENKKIGSNGYYAWELLW